MQVGHLSVTDDYTNFVAKLSQRQHERIQRGGWGAGGLTPSLKNHKWLSVSLQGLEHDHGQTDSQARAQRLSAAHHKVTWSILIGFIY